MKSKTAARGGQRGGSVLKLLVVVASVGLLAAVAYLLFRDNAETYLQEAFRNPPPPAPEPVTADAGTRPQDPESLMTLKPVPNRVFVSDGASPTADGTPPTDSSAVRSVTLPFVKLPKLNDSDAEVRAALVELAPQSLLADWLIDEELVRKFVVTVDNLAEGKFPRKHSLLRPIASRFRVVERDDRLWLDGYNFGRYAPYVDLFASLDVQQLRDTYVKYYPLMQRAYAELGYPRRSFHQRVLQAIDHLLQSPIHPDPLELVQPSVMYRYADPALEELSDVHKQMLRLGPVNARKLLDKLVLIRAALAALDHG